MHAHSDLALLHHARHVLNEHRARAARAALVADARRTELAHAPRATVALRAALALRLGRFARLVAAIAEDLDPSTARPLRG
jgi:hypothetical protein